MKLYTALGLVGLGLGIAGFATVQGCSSTTTATDGAGGRQPPAKPSAPATTSTDEKTFAIYELLLGETDRNRVTNAKNGWKDYGYNLDGLTTTKTDTNVCQRQAAADSAKQEDGKDGIDNTFGSTVLQFILSLLPTPSKTVNDSIQETGTFTVLLTVKGLTDDPAQTNTGLSGSILVGDAFGKKPTFAPTDDWPYRPEPKVTISDAFINKGTFVNGTGGGAVQLSLLFQGVALDLPINRAIITFDHSKPDEITNGTIAGVLNTEALVANVEKVAGRITKSLCTGSVLEQIKTTIRQASDMLDDGTNKPGVPCTAISIGVGFSGKRVGPPKTIATPAPIPADPCTEAGDAGADAQ